MRTFTARDYSQYSGLKRRLHGGVMLLTAIYQHLLSDRKFGLTHNLLATKVMPTLIPLTVAPGLNIDQARLTADVVRL